MRWLIVKALDYTVQRQNIGFESTVYHLSLETAVLITKY